MTSDLKKILSNKTKLIEREQIALERLIMELGEQFANDLQRIVGAGAFTAETIAGALEELGYSRMIIESLSKFENLLLLNRELAESVRVNFLLTPQNESSLFEFIQVSSAQIAQKFRDEIATDIYQFALQSKLSQRPIDQVVGEASERLTLSGRRAAVEVATALSTFDRTNMKMLYDQTGVERFFYFPPTLLPTSRQSCIDAVESPLQQTGWTMEDIAANPDIDFILGGKPYYNCRHEFIPFESAQENGLTN